MTRRRRWSFWMPPLEHPPILWLDDLYRGSLTDIGRLTVWGMLISSLSLLASGSYLIAATFWFSFFSLITSYILGFFYRIPETFRVRRDGLLKLVEGNTLHYRVEIENIGKRRLRSIVVEERGLVPELRPVGSPPVIAELEPGECRSVTLRVRGTRRGVYFLNHLQVANSLPTGMIKWGRRKHVHTEVVVEPLPLTSNYSDLAPITDDREHQFSTHAGSSTELIGIRGWRSGDQLRDVHWRATARRGELVAKEYADLTSWQRMVWLDVETRSASDEKILDEMLTVAIQFARECSRRQIDLTLCRAHENRFICLRAKDPKQYENLILDMVGIESVRKTNFQELEILFSGRRSDKKIVLMFLRLDSSRRALISTLRSEGYELVIWIGMSKQIPDQWRQDSKIEVWS